MEEDEIIARYGGVVVGTPESQTQPVAPAVDSGSAPSLGYGSMLGQAVYNAPSSIYGLGKDLATAVMNPIDTAQSVLDLGAGVLSYVLPDDMVEALYNFEAKYWGNTENADRAKRTADAVGKHYIEKYGSLENAKRAFATDPAAIVADASMVMGLASKLPVISKTSAGAQLAETARAIEPLTATARAVPKVAGKAGDITASVLGVTTGTGAEPIRRAYQAGREGGAKAEQFVDALTGQGNYDQILEAAKENLRLLRQQRSQQYQQGMSKIETDQTQLSFDDIDAAIESAADRARFKGAPVDSTLNNALFEIEKIVNQWKALDPEFHTPMGMDALKQKIFNEIVGKLPYDQAANARAATNQIVQAIRGTISRQAPTYAKVMKGYEDSSNVIQEIERSLSLGDKASADTAMRKLQSLMRDDVQTNYGQRQKLADELEAAGGPEFRSGLAGQSLAPIAPRGLQRGTSGLLSYGAYGAAGVPAAAITALASSPRAVGGAAYNLGAGVRKMEPMTREAAMLAAKGDPILANLLYQSQQINQ